MRVLHVITGLGAGGAEQQVRLLCRHSQVEAEVVTLTNPGVVAAGLVSDGVPVTDVAMRSNRDLRGLIRLVRLMRRGRFDCVHVHLFRAQLFGRLAARLAGVPHVVATEHSLGDRLIEGRPVNRPGVRLLYRAAERLGERTIAVSATTARRMLRWGVPADRVTVVPNGVDLEAFAFRPEDGAAMRARLGLPGDAVVVGTVGRLVPTKRTDLLLEAIASIPHVVGLVVGSGPAEDDLRALAVRLGVSDRVVFAGERDDVPAALAAMDVFVSACPEEAYGLAVIEALAAGLPVAYVACPALQEQAADQAPRAVRVAPDPEALAAAVRGLITVAGSRTPAPVTARYDIRCVAARVDEEYARLAGRSDRPMVPATRGGGNG
jgi:glycosyltransferase involved in cell wall biosynthesis